MKNLAPSFYLIIIVVCSFVLMSNIDIEKISYEPITSEKSINLLRPNGSPGDVTGSPGDGYMDCTDCHDSNLNFSLIPTISTNIPVTGYVLGETYTISVLTSSTGASNWGFELTSEKAGGTEVGTYDLTDATGSPKIITSGGSVTHSNSNSSSWSFNWTAPLVNEGDITFYAAVLAASGSGDQVVTTSSTVNYTTLSINDKNNIAFDVFPNPSSDFLTIKLPNEILGGSVEIFDFLGRAVVTTKINRIDNKLNVNNLSEGIYIIRLTSEDKSGIKKIIKK